MPRFSRFIIAGLFCLTAPFSFAQVQSELTELKAINTKLATQAGYLDGLEAGQAGFATAVNQAAIIGHIDGLESAIAALPQNNVLGAGTANIGDVDVLTLPALSAGNSNIGDVDVASSALPTGASTAAAQATIIGHVDGVEAALASLPQNNVLGAGTNNIGDVDVLTLPSLPAGTNAIGKLAPNSGVDIGDVDVTSSALPTGAATSAKQPALGTAGVSSTDVISVQGIASGTALPVSVASIPSHAVTNAGTFATQNTAATPAGTNNIGDVDVLTLPALVAGTANIGDVDVLSSALPTGAATSANQTTVIGHVDGIETAIAALPQNNVLGAGTANIGDVDVLSLPATPAGNNNIGDVDVASSALPTGAATSANQTTLSGQLPTTLGSKADTASLAVTQSTEDKAVLDSIKTRLDNGIKLRDEADSLVSWGRPATGAIITPVAVTTSSTSVYAGGDATIREVMVRNPSTSTGIVVCALAAAVVTVANGIHEIPPGKTMTTGLDGYVGEIRCISPSGTQTVAVGTVK